MPCRVRNISGFLAPLIAQALIGASRQKYLNSVSLAFGRCDHESGVTEIVPGIDLGASMNKRLQLGR